LIQLSLQSICFILNAAASNNKKLRSNVLALLKKDRSSFDILLRVASFQNTLQAAIEF